jgi:hypothetical protein
MHRPHLVVIIALSLNSANLYADEFDPKTLPAVKKALVKATTEVDRNRKAFDEANQKVFNEGKEAISKEVDRLTRAGKLEEAVAVKKFADNIGEQVLAHAEKSMTPPHPGKAGAVAWNGHKYKVFKEQCSWHEAKKRCEEMGGYLVIINDEKEQNAVVNLLAGSGVLVDNTGGRKWDGVWIGATIEARAGGWAWIDNSPMAFSRWVSGQPDGSGKYLKLCIRHGGRWDDQPAGGFGTSFFICEWDD